MKKEGEAMRKFATLMTLSIVFVVATSALAGLTAGQVTFHVTDGHGQAIEGVHIEISNERAKSFKLELTTDKHGRAKSVMKFDHYEAVFTKDGYQSYSYKFK
ncbi:MAG: hypothetical protein CO090_03200, partial [Acidobacteria bacterium CG_4_9_14_3_um_filter_49_7]